MLTDNAIIAFECIHALQNGSANAGKFCAFKLDLMKAYDRVDWKFLETSLRKIGFADKFIGWIMECVKTVRFSVRFNGKLIQKFCPSRGLRQGDPLSPILFLFVAEGLTSLMNNQINEGNIEELKICRRGPGISHLLFADDSLLFFKVKGDEARHIKNVLTAYEKSTGQLLNPAKSSLMLGQNVTEDEGAIVASILNVQNTSFEEKYLGLPIPEGRMKDDKFQPTKERLMEKCSDWTEKYSSGAAKEVLIKAVAQAIPTHAMSIFKFSAGLCDEFEQIIRNFWWGDDVEKERFTGWHGAK
jgi:hypothetical protein